MSTRPRVLNQSAASPAENSRRWLWWPIDYGVYLLAVAFFVVFAFVFVSDEFQSEWMVCYVKAAQRMWAGETIHRIEPVAYAYPPAMAMLAVPLAKLPDLAPLWGWYLVNVIAGVIAFGCTWRLIGGPSLVRLSLRWSIVFWLGMILSIRFFVAPLENQQTDMVIAALIFAGALLLCRGRDGWAALSWGAAAAMKCTPLLFAPYLLWRGKWKAAGLLVLVVVGLNAAPDLLFPQTSGGSYLTDWSDSFLGEVGRQAPGVWFSDILLNQSLAGMFNRYAQFGLPAADVGGLRVLVYGSGLFLLGITAWRFGRPGRAAVIWKHPTRSPLPVESLDVGVETAAIVCLMLLLSPMSSKAHYVVLLLPALMLARVVTERLTKIDCLLVAAMLLTGPLTAKGLIGKPWGDLMLAWGIPTWFALLALLAMWRVRGRVETSCNQVLNPINLHRRAA